MSLVRIAFMNEAQRRSAGIFCKDGKLMFSINAAERVNETYVVLHNKYMTDYFSVAGRCVKI